MSLTDRLAVNIETQRFYVVVSRGAFTCDKERLKLYLPSGRYWSRCRLSNDILRIKRAKI